ncbi:unnamed protein product, partial [Symbiodinium pilosum]
NLAAFSDDVPFAGQSFHPLQRWRCLGALLHPGEHLQWRAFREVRGLVRET